MSVDSNKDRESGSGPDLGKPKRFKLNGKNKKFHVLKRFLEDLRLLSEPMVFLPEIFTKCAFIKIVCLQNMGLDPAPDPDWIRMQQSLDLDPNSVNLGSNHCR